MGEVISMQGKLFQRIHKLLDQMEETVGRIETNLIREGIIETEEGSPLLKTKKPVHKKIEI